MDEILKSGWDPKKTSFSYTSRTGVDLDLLCSKDDLNPFGVVFLERYMTPNGMGTVLGCFNTYLWFQLDKEEGASYWDNIKDHKCMVELGFTKKDEKVPENLMKMLANSEKPHIISTVRTTPVTQICPICQKSFSSTNINDHLDLCIKSDDDVRFDDIVIKNEKDEVCDFEIKIIGENNNNEPADIVGSHSDSLAIPSWLKINDAKGRKEFLNLSPEKRERLILESLKRKIILKRKEALDLLEMAMKDGDMKQLEQTLCSKLVNTKTVASVFHDAACSTELENVKQYCIDFFARHPKIFDIIESEGYKQLPSYLANLLLKAQLARAEELELLPKKEKTPQTLEDEGFWNASFEEDSMDEEDLMEDDQPEDEV